MHAGAHKVHPTKRENGWRKEGEKKRTEKKRTEDEGTEKKGRGDHSCRRASMGLRFDARQAG
jgi:hypothetical protein